jgi:hypothetical protein
MSNNNKDTSNAFVTQKLTTKEKIKEFGSFEEWGKQSMLSILRISVNRPAYGITTGYSDQVNYDLYNDILHEEDFKHVIEPYGRKVGNFPATLQNYNIIKPKVDLLVGEEIKRPFNFRVVAENPEVISEVLEEKTLSIKQYLEQLILQEMQAAGLPVETPEGEPITPRQIEEYFTYNYKHIREKIANQSLNYLVKYENIKEQFNDGWKDLLICGKEMYWTGIINGEPKLRLVNPAYVRFDLSPDLKYIHDSQWVYEERYLTPSEIYDEFYDDLNEEDIDKIEQFRRGNYGALSQNATIGSYGYTDMAYLPATYPYKYDTASQLVRVLQYEWKGLKKIGFLSYLDENGIPQETQVSEEFSASEFKKLQPDNFIDLEWKWINCVYQGTQIGASVFCKVQEKPYQYWNLDNLSECKLSYTGTVYNKRNSKGTSLVEVMKPWQYLYNILMYRLELTFAKAKDKVFLMDIAQIPRSMGFDVDKWLYYLDALGIAFINSFEEGNGPLGAGRTSGFNQFAEIDLSLARVIDQYVMALERIKEEIGEISGVSRQRQGEVSTSERVGNVERTIIQSSHITEPMFETHNNVKRYVLTNLLECAQIAWVNGKKAQYILDDMSRVLFEIDGPELSNTQFSVFVSNSAKDNLIVDTLKNLANDALRSNLIRFSDVISILETESISDIKNKIVQSEMKQEQREQAAAQAEAEAAQKLEQIKAQDKQADRDLENEMNIRDNETKILVEKMKIQQGMIEETPEKETNIVADIIEMKKLEQKDKEIELKTDLELAKEQNKKVIEMLKLKMQNDALNVEKEKIKAQDKQNQDKIKADLEKNADSIKSNEKIADKNNANQKEINDAKNETTIKVTRMRPKPSSNK